MAGVCCHHQHVAPYTLRKHKVFVLKNMGINTRFICYNKICFFVGPSHAKLEDNLPLIPNYLAYPPVNYKVEVDSSPPPPPQNNSTSGSAINGIIKPQILQSPVQNDTLCKIPSNMKNRHEGKQNEYKSYT